MVRVSVNLPATCTERERNIVTYLMLKIDHSNHRDQCAKRSKMERIHVGHVLLPPAGAIFKIMVIGVR